VNIGRSAATDRNGDEMKARSSVFAIVTLVMLLTLPAGAGEKLTITVSPAVAFAPATLIVRARIDADPDNRAMEIVAESADFYRASEVPLNGDQAPHMNVFEFRSLPSGTYEVKATLLDAKHQARASVRSEVNVIQSGGGDRR